MGELINNTEFCEDLRVAINRNSVDAHLNASDMVIAGLIAGLLDSPDIQAQITRLQGEFVARMDGLVR